MERIKLLSIIFIILLIGCTPAEDNLNKRISYRDFGKQIELSGEIVQFKDSVWAPVRIFCTDSVLIIEDKSQDKMIQIFHKDKLTKIAENIPHGIGPNESLDCWTIQFLGNNVLMFDFGMKKLSMYEKTEFYRGNNIPQKTFKPKNATGVRMTVDGKLFGECLSDENSLITLFDTLGEQNNNFRVDFPELNSCSDKENYIKKHLFEFRPYYSEKHKRIFLTYTYTDLFDIYDNDFNLISRVHGPECFDPLLIDKGDYLSAAQDSKTSSVFSCLTENYIWVLYNGNKHMPAYPDDILVFDYDGNPKNIYHLNVSAISFCVDEKARAIYITAENPERCVMKFKY